MTRYLEISPAKANACLDEFHVIDVGVEHGAGECARRRFTVAVNPWVSVHLGGHLWDAGLGMPSGFSRTETAGQLKGLCGGIWKAPSRFRA